MTCSTCVQMQSKLKLTTVWANEGTTNIQISAVTRHDQSTEHSNACTAMEKQEVQTILEKDAAPTETAFSVAKEDAIVFNTIYFAAESEIPSSTVNGLLELHTRNGLDVKYTNLSWDSITKMQNSIAHVLRDELVNEIKSSGGFALMLDESTDETVDKRLSMCVRYVKGGELFTKMLYNVPIADGRAHTIVNCVVEEFEKLGISLADCTSLATDGAAAMMGKHTGAGKQMISKYSPFCVQTHCLAYRINLACSDSVKKN
ncbi:SCAN domain-containing protein 3-like [Mercenaria mercenaria]|uniref:SCAN domain-containing protein 3-like n=1 Tax=Mercenaria mercenaria TaxID=6596 RepID=UPI00234F8A68|nr:SCAN domain-containing protein 3-like [Mercenaria mercenaria]